MFQLVPPTKEDFKEWLNMRHILWWYHMKFTLRTEMKDIFKRTQKGEYMVYLARAETEYAGFIEFCLHEKAPVCNTSPVGYIAGWLVKEAYRGNGLGRELVKCAERWARDRGCVEMASDTNIRYYSTSPAAHNALGYETVLIEAERYYFRKDL